MTYKTMSGELYRELIDYGIRNLALHREEINDLNVFPVPDGDTGTNMVTTLRIGYSAIENLDGTLSEYCKRFTHAVIYGARGNSGVIISQFFKGFSESFINDGDEETEASLKDFELAVARGVSSAYSAVARPAEGTMLTVLRESSEHLSRSSLSKDENATLADIISTLLLRAMRSLQNTPELLPVLKQAGVVDSGGCGVVYIFEGMLKRLRGEDIESVGASNESAYIDYSLFNRHTSFEYGYCTEFLLQLLDGSRDFDDSLFLSQLHTLGDSIVCTAEGDKVKVHIHTKSPETVLALAHEYGEFLSLKIENMSVQHTQVERSTGNVRPSAPKAEGSFAVVAVAPTHSYVEMFESMGVDVVICENAGMAPSTSDFVKAFSATNAKKIIVFPNNSNIRMTALQARALYAKEDEEIENSIFVIDSHSVADCYAALAIIDFTEEDIEQVCRDIASTIENIYTVKITTAVRDAVFGEISINKHDYIAMNGMDLLASSSNKAELIISVIRDTLDNDERDTLTIFAGAHTDGETIEEVLDFVKNEYIYTETDLVRTDEPSANLLLSFE